MRFSTISSSINIKETNKELDSRFTPKQGPIKETLAWLRELRKQDLISYEKALELSDRVIRDTMMTQALGFPVDGVTELPEQSNLFPGAKNLDGSVNFSKSKKP